ncbi:substrate-binding domain-containing protein [Micromonospora sp. NPDC049559]|uniref:substrate-binding domain-containing protein n=1 Tax=Micromonospora sp. NPDC049559 TaxID=3155923 RepID=UPI003449352C
MSQKSGDVSRRSLLFGGAAVGAGTLLAACTSNEKSGDSGAGSQTVAGNSNTEPGKPVKIGFSVPAGDHGWILAVTTNGKAQAAKYSDVTFSAVESGGNDPAVQRAAVESLIQQKVDAIVFLPHEGDKLEPTALKAMEAGIQVINLDREFSNPFAYRSLIKGDNYGMGVAAGNFIAAELKKANKGPDAAIAEIGGIDFLPLTKERSRGFKDALTKHGYQVRHQVWADFTPAKGQSVTANLLQSAPKLDAVWNHDDDQGIGVLAAMKQAGRNEFFMVGGAGSRNAMDSIKKGDTPLRATVTYSPTMASSAVSIARLIAQGRGMGDLAELQVPKTIVLASETITKENVDAYLPLGFAS